MISISTDLINPNPSGFENELSFFQIECSQILQNICSEATSAFSIFSLMGAGWIGQGSKLSCLNFVSRFSSSQVFRQSSSFIFSAAVEGSFFHGCSALKQGVGSLLDFAKGSAHSGIILAGCKLSGGIAPQNFILTQLFQCFAIVEINEVCGGVLVERQIGSFGENMVRAVGTSIPMLISGQLLASCSSDHLIRQAKYNLKIEMKNKGHMSDRSFSLFCHERITPEGFRFRNEADSNEAEKKSNVFQMRRRGPDLEKTERIEKKKEEIRKWVITIQDPAVEDSIRDAALMEVIQFCLKIPIFKLEAYVAGPEESADVIQAAAIEVAKTVRLEDLETTSFLTLVGRQIMQKTSAVRRGKQREAPLLEEIYQGPSSIDGPDKDVFADSTYKLSNRFREHLKGDWRIIFDKMLNRSKEGPEDIFKTRRNNKRTGRGDEEAYLTFRFQRYTERIEAIEVDRITSTSWTLANWLAPTVVHEVPDMAVFQKRVEECFEVASRRKAKCIAIDFLGNANEDFPFIVELLQSSIQIKEVRIFYSIGSVRRFFKGLTVDPERVYRGYAPVTAGEDSRTFFEYEAIEIYAVCMMTPFKDSNPLGNYLIRSREKAGLESIREAAEEINRIASEYGVDELKLVMYSLNLYESGQQIPPENMLRWICRVYAADEEIALHLRELQIRIQERNVKSESGRREAARAQALALVPHFPKDPELTLLVRRIEKAIRNYSEGKEEDLFVECPADFLRRIRIGSDLTVDEAVARIREVGKEFGLANLTNASFLSYERNPANLLILAIFAEAYQVNPRVFFYVAFQKKFPELNPKYWIVPIIPAFWLPPENRKNLSRLIRSARESHFLTQEQIVEKAKLLGIPLFIKTLLNWEKGTVEFKLPLLLALSDPSFLNQDQQLWTYLFFNETHPMIDPISLRLKRKQRETPPIVPSQRKSSKMSTPTLLRRLRKAEGFPNVDGIVQIAKDYGISRSSNLLGRHEIDEDRIEDLPSNLFSIFYGKAYGLDARIIFASDPRAFMEGSPYYPIRILAPFRSRLEHYQSYDPERRSLSWRLFVYRNNPYRATSRRGLSTLNFAEKLGINNSLLEEIELCKYDHILSDSTVDTLAFTLGKTPDEIRAAYRFQREKMPSMTAEKYREKDED